MHHLKGNNTSMRTNKRIFALLLACLFCLGSLAACSGGGAQTDVTTDPADTTAPTDDGKWPEIEGTVIYVDPTAGDGGDGSDAAPFKSISEAQAKIREMKSGEGLPAGGITVLLASGEYSAMDTVTFTAEDSGTEACPITYMSAEKHGAVFTGGISLNAADFSPISDEEKAKLTHLPTSLEQALDALEADHDYLLAGGVFPEELITKFIRSKREECRALAAIPHPAEFDRYYNL